MRLLAAGLFAAAAFAYTWLWVHLRNRELGRTDRRHPAR